MQEIDTETKLMNTQKLFRISKTRSPNHPDLTIFYDNISTYTKALPFCERAVGIEESVLPSNHPDLQRYKRISSYEGGSPTWKSLLS